MSTDASMAPLTSALNRVSAAPIARIVTSRAGSMPLAPSASRSKISSMVPRPETATFFPRSALMLANSGSRVKRVLRLVELAEDQFQRLRRAAPS